ncbi:MAG TPA: R3H domain-containing nucleic acid-binding protein [Patescibacteria group bacterium]|nr:R3H domain-containing nucleic acid-binding protein [Patescibacteria group bacterium]
MAKAIKNDLIKIVEEVTKQLIDFIGVKAEIEVKHVKDQDLVNVDIKADEEAGLIIGKKGETINAIQLIINASVRTKMGEWHRVYVNVADFREKEVTRLQELAQQTVQRAKDTGLPQNLYNLTPSQRRTIHIFLADEKDIVTESTGEGKDRYLIVKIK